MSSHLTCSTLKIFFDKRLGDLNDLRLLLVAEKARLLDGAAQRALRIGKVPQQERQKAVGRCGANAEITRFKGLGEISPDEFREFIGENIRLDKVRITKDDPIHDLLEFYMGKNTYERQGFIIDNLRIEEDIVEQDLAIN